MKVFLICCEKSGNNILYQVLEQLKRELNDFDKIVFSGIVFSETATKFNIKQLFHPQELAVLGIGDVIFNLPKIVDRITDVANYVSDFQPDLLISVDAYDFCIRVVKKIRALEEKKKNKTTDDEKKDGNNLNPKQCIQMWHIVAPSVWAYWSFRAKTLAKYYDRLFYLLPFEKKYFKPLEIIKRHNGRGFLSTFIGYPATFQNRNKDIQKDNELIGITLGSRNGEIYRHKNLIISVIMKLKMINKNFKFAILTTPDTNEFAKKALGEFRNISFIDNEEEKNEIIQKCVLCIAKSGTNNIEIGSLGTPMVVYYKTSFLTYLFAKIFAKIKFINLFNITLNKNVIPELIQQYATADNIVNTVMHLLTNNGIRIKQVEQIDKAISMMQRDDKKYPANVIIEEIIKYKNTL